MDWKLLHFFWNKVCVCVCDFCFCEEVEGLPRISFRKVSAQLRVFPLGGASWLDFLWFREEGICVCSLCHVAVNRTQAVLCCHQAD